MPKIEQSMTIAVSPETVFAALASVQHSPSWISALTSVRDIPVEVVVGSRFVETASFMGKEMETGKEVTVYEPPRCFAHRSTSGPVPQELVMSVEPVDGGSSITVRFEAEPNEFFGTLPLNVLVVAMEVLIRSNLKKLKKMLEHGDWPPMG